MNRKRQFSASLGLMLLCAASFLSPFSLKAQDLSGVRSGNYSGVDGVFFNPANVAGSKYRWSLGLFSTDMVVGNDAASFKLKDIGSSFNGDSLKQKLTGNNAKPVSASLSLSILGPSLLFNIGKNNGFAITTRARIMVNMRGIDGKLVNQFINAGDAESGLPYSFSTASNNVINVNAWTEFGFSYGRVLLNAGPIYLKAGATLKYLAGFANGYLQLNGLQGTLNQDITNNVYLSQTTGQLGLGFGGTNLDDIQKGKVGAFNGSGIGADLGGVFELRLKPNSYLFKFSVALLDIGSINYKKDTARSGSYTASITGAQKAYVSDFGKLDNYKAYFEGNPQFYTPAASNNQSNYSVQLPTTLQIDVDYHAIAGLYINLASQFALTGKNANKPYDPGYYNSVTLTPRFETKHFGVYLPVSYSDLTHLNTGFCIRIGPAFFGSGSMLSSLLGGSKQTDFFSGIQFGVGRK